MQMFQFVMTSPLLFVFLLFSKRHRLLVKETSKNVKSVVFPVFWDLVLEDLPQLALPIHITATTPYWEWDTITVVSLTGTSLMTLVNLGRVCVGCKNKAKKSIAEFDKELQLAETGGKVLPKVYKYNDNKKMETILKDLGEYFVDYVTVLKKHGYDTCAELREAELSDFIKDCNMKKPHAKRLLKTVQMLISESKDTDSNEREKTAPINALVENNGNVSAAGEPENKRVSL